LLLLLLLLKFIGVVIEIHGPGSSIGLGTAWPCSSAGGYMASNSLLRCGVVICVPLDEPTENREPARQSESVSEVELGRLKLLAWAL
jgi:hypothetical protein